MKKHIQCFIGLLLAAVTALSVGTLSYAVSNFTTKSQFTGKTYTHYGSYADTTVKDMIDVSEHNGLINWYKIKALGIDDAIIRVGYRGYGSGGGMYEDNYFYDNIEGAAEAGVRVGIYFYSQALDTKEAAAEAEFCLKRVKNYKLSLPIFFDYEFAEVSTGRLDAAWNSGKLNKAKMTANVIAFCDAIKKAGYKAGIYSSSGFYTYQYNADNFLSKGYEFWNAYYTTNSTSGSYWPNKNHVYKYWQYGGDNVQGCCGAPSAAWLKVKYNGVTGYVSAQYIDFTSATVGKSITDGLNLRKGGSTSYTSLAKIPKGGKVNILSYPTGTFTDLNFYYYSAAVQKPNYRLSATSNSVTVKWDKMSGMSSYRVYSYDTETGKYSRLTTTTALSYTCKNLTKNTKYTYLVRAFDAAGVGTPYTVKDNKSITTATAKPAFSMTAASGTALRISWNKVSGATGYRVYSYNAATEKFTRLASISDTAYTVTGLSAGSKEKLLVRAFNASGVGSDYTLSDVKSFATAPAAPKFTLTGYSNKVKIQWSAVKSASMYRIYSYNTATKEYKRLAQTTGTAWTVADTKPHTTYTYLVRAFNADVSGSDYTAKSNVSILTPPAAPQFTLSPSGSNGIQVKWSAVNGVAYYKVYTYDAQQKHYHCESKTTALKFIYKNAVPGTTYTFLVRAYRADGAASSYTAAERRNLTLSMQKAVFQLSSPAKGTALITWKQVPAAANYRVYSYDAASGTYTRVAKTTALSCRLTGLKSGKTYTYLVRAFYENGLAAAYTQADRQNIAIR